MEEKYKIWTETTQGRAAIGLALALFLIIAGGITVFIVWSFSQDSVKIDGKTYTISDLKSENPGLYGKYRTEHANLLRETFSEFAEKKILQLAMKEQGLSSEEEVFKKGLTLAPPDETELLAIYNQYKNSPQLQGKSYHELRDLIRKSVVGNQERMHAQTVQKSLVEKYKVSFAIQDPPPVRQQVAEDGNPTLGPSDAKVTIVEFSDFECPYCKRSQEVNQKLREKYKGKIRWVFRDFPLEFHENAMYAHMAANCAIPQGKYWEFFQVLFDNSGNLAKGNVDYLASKAGLNVSAYKECMQNEEALESEIRADIQTAQKLGVTGTPAFFINGIFVNGARPFEHFDEIIKKELD
jgi:protein-disulfide isomerase